ncbi:MAG: FAD-dependent oxidoreductase [Ginsengibacter sp.]
MPAPSYIFTDEIIPTWWTQYSSKQPLLTGWIAGPSSIKIKNYSQKKFKIIILKSLSSVFSMHITDIEKKLKNFKVMNWIREPHILGGYSYPTLKTKNAREILQVPFENSFYFAGEYIGKDSSSTVDAALKSGREVAGKILKEEEGMHKIIS